MIVFFIVLRVCGKAQHQVCQWQRQRAQAFHERPIGPDLSSSFNLLPVISTRLRLQVMQPVVNIDDPVGKVVGKRANLTQQTYIDYALNLQNSLRGLPQ
jgi:hypothetical protein